MKKIIFSILTLTCALTSCNDSFLDKQPETQIGRDKFFNTEEDLNLSAFNLYDFPGTGIYTTEAYSMTDNAWSTGNVELKTIMTSSTNATNLTTGWSWTQLRNINFYLENFSKAKISEERLKHFEGLGRFFRARFYAEKVKRYSDVPWVAQVLTPENEAILFAARDKREVVVQKIMEDYEFAIANIDVTSARGAINRWVAKADFARFALYEGTYRKYHSELNLTASANTILKRAAEVSKEIMDNSAFKIHNTGKAKEDYGVLFSSADLASNTEVIFARYYQADILNGDSGEGVFGNYETFPLKDLLQSYLMADGKHYSAQQGYQQYEFVKEFQDRDPRLYQTFAYPGWELKRSGTYAQGAGIYVQQLAKNFSGYHQIKGFYNTTDWPTRNNVDIPLYRFAEVLLIFAEAKAELGELSQSDLDVSVNLLRKRAGMPNMKLNPPIDPVMAARFKNVATGQKAEILEIRRERRVELAFEGQRFDDLMRWEAGKLLESEPQGIYFSKLGKHDLTGDGVPDVIFLPSGESIPSVKESNSLGKVLQYYRVGRFGQDVSVFFETPTSGNIQVVQDAGTFVNPKFYYRPVPQTQVTLNPNLKQIFGWE